MSSVCTKSRVPDQGCTLLAGKAAVYEQSSEISMMPIRAAASIVVAVFLAMACHRQAPSVAPVSEPDHFAIVLEHSAKGLTAHCEAGCKWVDVSMSCGRCDVRLDASGIGPVHEATPSANGFAFVLSPDGPGWKARAIQGARWITVGWSCGTAVCRVRLDETGVGPSNTSGG